MSSSNEKDNRPARRRFPIDDSPTDNTIKDNVVMGNILDNTINHNVNDTTTTPPTTHLNNYINPVMDRDKLLDSGMIGETFAPTVQQKDDDVSTSSSTIQYQQLFLRKTPDDDFSGTDSDDAKPKAKKTKTTTKQTIQLKAPPKSAPTTLPIAILQLTPQAHPKHAPPPLLPPPAPPQAATKSSRSRKRNANQPKAKATSRQKKAPKITVPTNMATTNDYITPSRHDGNMASPQIPPGAAAVLPNAPGETTARKTKKKTPPPKIKVGANVLVRQDHL
jgi:hypothetical protein